MNSNTTFQEIDSFLRANIFPGVEEESQTLMSFQQIIGLNRLYTPIKDTNSLLRLMNSYERTGPIESYKVVSSLGNYISTITTRIYIDTQKNNPGCKLAMIALFLHSINHGCYRFEIVHNGLFDLFIMYYQAEDKELAIELIKIAKLIFVQTCSISEAPACFFNIINQMINPLIGLPSGPDIDYYEYGLVADQYNAELATVYQIGSFDQLTAGKFEFSVGSECCYNTFKENFITIYGQQKFDQLLTLKIDPR